jgi:phosphatidylglycerol lysyltransferase
MKRRWILWILIIAFVWLVISRFTEVEKIIKTLAEGQWQWVLLAAILQILYYTLYTGLYQSAFDTVEVRSRFRDLFPLTFVAIFVNVAVPAGGAGGAAVFVDETTRRGESAVRTTAGTLLALIADFGTFTLVLIVGMIYLFTLHDLQLYEIVGALILLGLIGGMSAALFLGLWQPDWLHRIMVGLQRTANTLAHRLRRADFFKEDWAEKYSAEVSEAAMAIATHPDRLWRTLAIAFTAQVVDLSSLYCLFLAFHHPVGLGVLVAGFAMGILFWIVSITPQGIGVVEGMMTLVFTSLGVPTEASAIISLSFRGLTFWLPLVLGFVLLRRTQAFKPAMRPSSEATGVNVAAVLTGLMGLINLFSAVTPSLADRLQLLERYTPFGLARGGHLASALSGFALLVLSVNLWRRKRVAWLLTEIALVLSIFAHLLKGLDYEEAFLAAALAVWLLYLRPHFHARSDPPSIRQGLTAIAGALAFTLVYGAAGFYLLDRHYQVNFGLWASLRQTVIMFTQFYDPGLQPITRFGRYFADSIYTVSAVTLAYAIWMLARPVLARRSASPAERTRARQIVEAWGHSSLAGLTLLTDKSYFFSPGGSVVAYVVKGRIALVLGDPIGPPDDMPACLAAFASFCSTNDWQPAYYQVLPEGLETYKAAGYDILCIGHEAIVDLSTFTLAGGANKGIRTATNKMTKLGYRAEVISPPHAPERLRELQQISDEWLTNVHGSEKRFSLGWFDEDYLNSGPIIVICDPQGQAASFANIVSEYHANEATIDLMRHRSQGESGQMDFLFASLFEWAKEKGFATFNLGLSALSGIGEQPKDPLIEQALHFIYEHVNQFYNFKGLHEFKSKFHPTWAPRYLAYPGPASLPAVAVALIRADQGDDLLGGYIRHS